MEWGDFSCLIFSSSRACLQFSVLSFSFFFSFLFRATSLSHFSSSWWLEVIQRSCQYRQVVQKPWGSFSLSKLASIFFLIIFLCSLSSLFLSLSCSLYYPVVWQAEPCWISLFYLHCASGWHCVLELGYSQVCVHLHECWFGCVHLLYACISSCLQTQSCSSSCIWN